MIEYSKLRDRSRDKSLVSHLPLAHPWSLYVELTNRCNFKCKFCPESIDDYAERVGGISHLDFDKFKKICSDILAIGRLKVLRIYMMGEPFLHKDLPDMVAYAKEQNVADRIEVTSNGSAITAKNAERIIASGLDYLRISIYAMDDERHKSVTQTNIPPEKIETNVRTLFEKRAAAGSKKPFIYVKMIDPYDEDEKRKLFDTYSGICDEVAIEPPMNWDNPEGENFIENVYGTSKENETDKLFVHKKEVCPFPFYTAVIHSSGDVSVCCVDWEKKTVYGNIFEQSLGEIWNSDGLKAFQRMHIERRKNENDACRGCTYLYTVPDNLDQLTDIRQLYPEIE